MELVPTYFDYSLLLLQTYSTLANVGAPPAPPFTGSKCFVDDALTFTIAPYINFDQVTAAKCQDACTQVGPQYILAGITQGYICLCGSDPSSKLNERLSDLLFLKIAIYILELYDTQNANLCSMDCSNGDKCGGPRGLFSVYDALKGKPEKLNFTLIDVVRLFNCLFIVVFCNIISLIYRMISMLK